MEAMNRDEILQRHQAVLDKYEARCREIMEAWSAEHGPPPPGMAWSPEWVFKRNAEGEQEPILVDVVAVDPPGFPVDPVAALNVWYKARRRGLIDG